MLTVSTRITPTHPHWPVGLHSLGEDMPQELWVQGDTAALADVAVAVVGTGPGSDYGRTVAGDIAEGLTDFDLTVVTGVGSGTDSTALTAVAAAGGIAVAYRATSLNSSMTVTAADLVDEIVAAGGAVVSATPPGTASRAAFALRQRLVAAHAGTYALVEASTDSTLLDVAREARAAGRAVGAVPGSVRDEESSGCLQLLAEGSASIVRDAADVAALTANA